MSQEQILPLKNIDFTQSFWWLCVRHRCKHTIGERNYLNGAQLCKCHRIITSVIMFFGFIVFKMSGKILHTKHHWKCITTRSPDGLKRKRKTQTYHGKVKTWPSTQNDYDGRRKRAREKKREKVCVWERKHNKSAFHSPAMNAIIIIISAVQNTNLMKRRWMVYLFYHLFAFVFVWLSKWCSAHRVCLFKLKTLTINEISKWDTFKSVIRLDLTWIDLTWLNSTPLNSTRPDSA